MEQKAFIEKVARLRPLLEMRAAFLLNNDRQRAEDAVSDLFLRLWERRSQLDNIQSMEAFCTTCLKRIVIDDLRKKSAEELPEEMLGEDDNIEQYELNELLQKAIRLLPPIRKRVYILHELKGYETQEIAELLNIKREAVHNHMHRARKQMKEFLLKQMR